MKDDVGADFRNFVAARSQRLLSAAYLLTGDHGLAEDLLQTALLKAYRHWGRVSTAGDPEAYVRRILFNQRVSWWRRRQLEAVSIPAYHDSVAGTVEDASSGLADRDRMWRALRELPPRTRAVVVLRYWEDLSETATAELLDCSVGTVKSLASRGLARLRGLLDPDPETAGGDTEKHDAKGARA
ncbi:MAG TPA: SigE family RNA polymerase sigma factor [Mycobacteriales bacterium]|nr:SigE family RNA polymerase sigma factor [Mycobacteriales bacterium]